MSVLADIPELEVFETVRELGKVLLSEGPIAVGAEINAYHIAIAVVNGLDYFFVV